MAARGEFAPSDFTMDIHITLSKAKPSNDEALLMKTEREKFVRAACAAFNSKQREVLKLRIYTRGVAQERIDEWREGTWGELCKRLKPPQWQKCLDFSRPSSEFLYYYTKPTSQPTTLSYNIRIPTDTSTELVEGYHQVMTILSRGDGGAAAGRPYFDFDEHLPQVESPELPEVASNDDRCHIIGLLELKLGDTFNTPESKTVQFKKLKDGKALAANIDKHASDYMGAFANHEGGWIIVGIEDTNCKVIGQEVSEETKSKIISHLDKCAKRKIWGSKQEVPTRGKHWDIFFQPLGEEKYLVEIRVNPFYGGVFQKKPESYIFEVNEDGEKVVEEMKFGVWIEATMREKLAEERCSYEMQQKFEKLSTYTAGGCQVFALKNSHRDIQERMFTIKKGLHIWPETYNSLVHNTAAPFLKNVIQALKDRFTTTKGVCVVSQCILSDIGIRRPTTAAGVKCDVLVFTETDVPFIISLGSSEDGERYCRRAAAELDDLLTKHSGEGRFFTKSCWCDLSTDQDCIPGLLESLLCYHPADKPASYHQMHLQKLQALVSGLVIAIAAFTPETYLYMNDLMGVQVMNLLTPSQLLALKTCQEVPYVCIQGYPGTGKTVVGIERAKQLRLDGAEVEEVLYIPSNGQMARYVRELTFPKNSSLHGSKICLSEAFKDIIQKLKDGTMPQTVKYLILDDTQNLLSRRNVPATNLEEDIKNFTPDMKHLAVRKTEPFGLLRIENYHVDWLRCVCIWVCTKQDSKIVIICDEAQSLEKEHYYKTLQEFIKESNGSTVTLNVVIRNSEEITKFFQHFVSTEAYGELPTTAHDFKGKPPVLRPTLLSTESLHKTINKFISMGYSPSEISLIRHEKSSDRTAPDRCLTTPQQKECMTLYRDINQQLIEMGIGHNGIPQPQVLHAVLFFCLLTQELLVSQDGDQDATFKISLASSCFARGEHAVTPPIFLQHLLGDRSRYDAPVRNAVVCLLEKRWQYLCTLYKTFISQDHPLSTDEDLLEERKVSLLGYGKQKLTNLQKLYVISEFLLGPVTIPEHIFRIVDVQHAGFYSLIIFHILPNVHAIQGTHEVPARGQCIRIESLEGFAGRENQVVIGLMPSEDTLKTYRYANYIAALVSRARTKCEILSFDICLFITEMKRDKIKLKMIETYFEDDEDGSSEDDKLLAMMGLI